MELFGKYLHTSAQNAQMHKQKHKKWDHNVSQINLLKKVAEHKNVWWTFLLFKKQNI